MKKLLVTGCNGQLGRAINEYYANQTEYELVNTDFGVEGIKSLDITNLDDVITAMEEIRPYAVINCAAHTAVDLCEVQQDLAYKINAIGPRNLSIAASKTGAKMMHISTDYVFAGDGTKPYTEFDQTAPKAMYGITKLAGENFVKTMLRLSETHDRISVVNDQIGSPTSAKELAKAIGYLIPTDNYGLFHGTCEGQCSWADFTKEIFKLAGKKTEVAAVTTEEYMKMNPNSAKRPAYSVLENYMLKLTTEFAFADWEDAIHEYMKEMV